MLILPQDAPLCTWIEHVLADTLYNMLTLPAERVKLEVACASTVGCNLNGSVAGQLYSMDVQA